MIWSQPARVSFTRTSPGRPGPARGSRAGRRPRRARRCSPRSQLLDPLDDQGEDDEHRGGDGEEGEIWHVRGTPEVVGRSLRSLRVGDRSDKTVRVQTSTGTAKRPGRAPVRRLSGPLTRGLGTLMGSLRGWVCRGAQAPGGGRALDPGPYPRPYPGP